MKSFPDWLKSKNFPPLLAAVVVCLLPYPGTPLHANPSVELDAFVSDYCLECHDSATQKGELDLEILLDNPMANHSESWERVVRQLDARHMPPIGEDRPSDATYQNTVGPLVADLDQIAEANPNPGRTDTLRRLTRTEYRNAIRDILALDIEVSELLPADESSHGFDNITVGDLSPALLERYISAAQKISRLAVGTGAGQIDSRTIRIRADISQSEHFEGLPLGTRGGALISHHFPQDGEYEVKILLTRDRNEEIEGMNGQHELEVLLDNHKMASFELKPPKKTEHTKYDSNLKVRFPAKAGPAEIGVTFVKWPDSLLETKRQPYDAQFNFHRHPRQGPAIYQISITGPFDATGPGTTPSRAAIFTSLPETEEGERQGASEILGRIMRLAYRRPITSDDVERILPFFEAGREEAGHFEGGIEAALSAVLVSRDFLFRLERDPEVHPEGAPYSVTDLELASRLSFFLWSSIPDDELLSLAETGRLHVPDVLREQTARMLADDRSVSLVTNFADQWLYLRNLDSVTPDPRMFPDFDHNLRDSFRQETEMQVERVIREDRSVLDLLTPDDTYLNGRLAAHYGVPHVYGSRFRPVSIGQDDNRGGLLRQGSILTVTSYANRTSPVIRGNWILENLLGTPPPPPPPNVEALDDSRVSESLPMRERLALHRELKSCASCHNLMDPIGFSLENFDAVGRWREFENGRAIDASGGLPDGNDFAGVEGLEKGILQRPEQFVRTTTEKLLTFGLGRGIEPYDAPAVRKILRQAAEGDYAFSSIIFGIVRSEPFMMRMAESSQD